jgi:DNA-binding HxlR family transcriptional regulator
LRITSGAKAPEKLSAPVHEADRTWRGFNLFDAEDLRLLEVLLHGEFNISGFRNRSLRRLLASKTAPQISRTLKRLGCHGLIKKVSGNYRYHLTTLGRVVGSLALQLRTFLVTPALAQLAPARS